MLLIHGDRAEPDMPEMTGPLAPRRDCTGIGPMHPRQRGTQAVCVGGYENEMNIFRHSMIRNSGAGFAKRSCSIE